MLFDRSMELLTKEHMKEKENLVENGEAILHDCLDQIFKHLNVKDLCRASAVCW